MLTTLQFVQDCLNNTRIPSSQLNALFLAADQAIKTELDRDIEQRTYTEYYGGSGTRYIVLRQTPVIALSSVNVNYAGYYGRNTDNPFDTQHLFTDGKDYVMEWDDELALVSNSGRLIRIGSVWSELNKTYTQGKATQEVSPAIGNIKVVYTAGYNPVPYDLQFAVAQVVASMTKLVQYGYPVQSEKIGDYSYKLANYVLQVNMQPTGSLARIMRMYKRTPW